MELPSTHVALPDLGTEWRLIRASALADGSLALLGGRSSRPGGWYSHPSGFLVPTHDGLPHMEARLWTFTGQALLEGPSFPLETAFPLVDRFQDGRWLVVAARTSGEPNARVLDPDGTLHARFMLGDGIEHLGVDGNDQIWVGWFDEGVFGNENWRVPGQEWAPSRGGLGLFTPEGTYRPLLVPPEAGMMADCYALNVVADGAWACLYTDFPLLHLRADGPARWWSPEFGGESALAVAGARALVAGGYGARADRLLLVALEGDGAGGPVPLLKTSRLPLVTRVPDRGEHPDSARFHVWRQPLLLAGRGETMHLVQDGTWRRWRVGEAAA